MYNTALQCVIIFLMAYRKIKTYRIIVTACFFQDYLFKRFTKFFTSIIFFYFESPNYQPLQVVKFTRAFQVPKHAVQAVKVFSRILNKQDFIFCINVTFTTGKAFQ